MTVLGYFRETGKGKGLEHRVDRNEILRFCDGHSTIEALEGRVRKEKDANDSCAVNSAIVTGWSPQLPCMDVHVRVATNSYFLQYFAFKLSF